MHIKYGTLVLAAVFLASCGTGPALSPDAVSQASEAPEPAPQDAPLGRLDPSIEPIRYRLDLTILPDQPDYSGIVVIDLRIAHPVKKIFLHGKDLQVTDVEITTFEDISYAGHYEQVHSTGVAGITFDRQIPAGTARLRLTYSARFPKGAQGLYRSTVAGESYAFTQFQPISARRLFPGFDEPVFKTPYDLTVTTYTRNTVVTNAPEKKRTRLDDGLTRFEFVTTRPLPSYLLAFAVGPLDIVDREPLPANEIRRRPLPLRGVTTRGNGTKIRFALENTRRIVSYLEHYFAVPFPYPKLDLIASPDFGTSAMENAGAIIYGDALILLAENAPLQQQRTLGSVHAHELAHHWFGDLVTPKWWDDIWLNESFASWMGNKTANAWRPELGIGMDTLTQALETMQIDSLVSARQIRQPIDQSLQIAGSFDGITYRKGAGVLSMFESYLGESGFRDGIRLHMRRFEHRVADVENFMSSLAKGSGRPDVVPAFRSFIDQPGVPIVSVAVNCEANHASLLVSQARYLPAGSRGNADQIWQIPLCVRSSSNGVAVKQCKLVTKKVSEILLDQSRCPDFVMPNADGAGYYRFALDEKGWSALIEHFDELTEKEALTLADSLSAAYRANRLSTQAYIAAVRIIARAPSRLVAMAPSHDLVMMRDDLAATEAARQGVQALMTTLYQPRLDALGAPVSEEEAVDLAALVDTQLAKTELVGFLALQAGNRSLLSDLATRAKAYLGFGQAPDESAIDPALLDTALRAGMLELGMPFMEALFQRLLASDDARFRSQASSALGFTDDPAVGQRVRALALDERLRARETSNMINALARRPSQRRQTFDWYRKNIDAYQSRMPAFTHRWQSRLASGFCTLEERDEVSAFFAPLVEKMQGGKRTLAGVIEEIELCAALAEQRRREVNDFFAAEPR